MPAKPAQEGPGRGRLSPTVVVDRAMALADAEGLDAVTVRRLAELLGVTPMALYWHFRDKKSLLGALGERVVAEVDLGIDDGPWADQLRALTTSLLQAVRAHPWATRLLTVGGLGDPSGTELQAIEVILGILSRGGLSPAQAVNVTRQVLRTVVGLVADEPTGRQPKSSALVEGLPSAEFPHVRAAAEPLTTCDDPDDYYAFGLELLLAGIRTIAAEATAAP